MEPTFQPAHEIGGSLFRRYRRLPHWQLGGSTYFLTFPLIAKAALLAEERALVRAAVLHWYGTRWTVHVLSVMPDHVHLLATPLESSPGHWHSLSGILQSVKGYSARGLNKRWGTTGPVWQSETYDRIVSDAAEFEEKAAYILNNAVTAGLSEDGWEYDGFWCEEGPE